MLESSVQTKILKYLGTVAYVVKIVAASKIGIPDVLVCYRGLFIAFEIKRPKNPSKTHQALQEYNKQCIIANLGLAYTVDSLDQVKQILRQIDDTLPTSNKNS